MERALLRIWAVLCKTMITGMVLVFTFHIFEISISKSLYLLSFSNSFAETLLSLGTLISISWHVCLTLSLITISGRLARIVRSVWIEKSHNMVTALFSVTGSGLCSYHFSSVSIPYCLHTFQWIYCPTRSCLFLY